jgi:hypothetical protein
MHQWKRDLADVYLDLCEVNWVIECAEIGFLPPRDTDRQDVPCSRIFYPAGRETLPNSSLISGAKPNSLASGQWHTDGEFWSLLPILHDLLLLIWYPEAEPPYANHVKYVTSHFTLNQFFSSIFIFDSSRLWKPLQCSIYVSRKAWFVLHRYEPNSIHCDTTVSTLTITVSAWFKAWTVLVRSNTGAIIWISLEAEISVFILP